MKFWRLDFTLALALPMIALTADARWLAVLSAWTGGLLLWQWYTYIEVSTLRAQMRRMVADAEVINLELAAMRELRERFADIAARYEERQRDRG